MEKETTPQPQPTANIHTALLAAQKEMGPVFKNATNPAFKSKYADLGAVIETITDPLHNNGIVFYQVIGTDGTNHWLDTSLVLAETGDKIVSHAPIISKDPTDPQKFGGAVTYQRRYSLLSLLGLAPEDDDGNEASKLSAPHYSQPVSRPASTPPVNQTKPVAVQPGDLECEVPGCTNTIWKSKEAANRHLHNGHIVCFNHSTEGGWEELVEAGEVFGEGA